MTPSDNALTRHEIATLLVHVIYRTLLPRQNLAQSRQDCLDALPKEVLSVSKPVNTTGTHGEQGDQ